MRRTRKIGISFGMIGFILLLAAGQVQAERFYFFNITNNSSFDAATGERQLFMDVFSLNGGTEVLFQFGNLGPDLSSITDVYFDDNMYSLLLNITNIINENPLNPDQDVSFSEGASPPNLPGGNSINPTFTTTQNLLANSNSPTQPSGVNPGEYLGITFALSGDKTYDDVLSGLSSKSLRVGLHVQGFESGGSESFINNSNPVPEPTTLLLLGPGLIGLACLRNRIKRNKI